MADRSKPETAAAYAAAFALAAGMVNYASAHWFAYPVVYCAFRPLMPLFAGLFYWLWLVSIVVFVVSMFTTGMSKATLQATGLFFLAHLIPAWAGTLFGLGLTC